MRAVRVHPYYEDSEAQTASAIHELNQNLGAHIENANAPNPWSTPARYAPSSAACARLGATPAPGQPGWVDTGKLQAVHAFTPEFLPRERAKLTVLALRGFYMSNC